MGILARWTSKLRRLWGLSPADKWLVLHAVYWLAVARLWLIRTPFPDLAERLRAEVGAEEADSELLRRVGYAVTAAGSNVPWRSDCFVQAIAANRMLRKLGYRSMIHLGVNKNKEGGLLAHAWLTCSGTIITGGAVADRYVGIHHLGE